MKDIKLIVTDMDGTLLNNNHEMSLEFAQIYGELKRRNILFVPASGRQMAGITKYFEDYQSEMGFIAENGGYVIYKDQEIFVDEMDHRYIGDIISAIREIPGADAVLSAKTTAYYESKNQKFVDYFTHYYIKNQKVNDLTDKMNDSIFKIAVYHPGGSEKNLYPFLKKFKEYNLEVVVSGEFWLDIMTKDINKGKALSELQKSLEITPDQTMAFGDYMNDIEMLKRAKYSYAMQNAHPAVKDIAVFEAYSNNDFGVLQIIKELLLVTQFENK